MTNSGSSFYSGSEGYSGSGGNPESSATVGSYSASPYTASPYSASPYSGSEPAEAPAAAYQDNGYASSQGGYSAQTYAQPEASPYEGYQQAPYPQAGYPAPAYPAAGYGASPYPYGAYGMLPEHPQAQTVMILGLVSLVVSLAAPVAWVMGSRARRDIREHPELYRESTSLTVGWVLGMVISLLMIAGIAFYAVFVIFMIILGVASS